MLLEPQLAQEQERRRLDRLQMLRSRIEEMLKDEGYTLADLFPDRPHRRGRSKGRSPQSPDNNLSDVAV